MRHSIGISSPECVLRCAHSPPPRPPSPAPPPAATPNNLSPACQHIVDHQREFFRCENRWLALAGSYNLTDSTPASYNCSLLPGDPFVQCLCHD